MSTERIKTSSIHEVMCFFTLKSVINVTEFKLEWKLDSPPRILTSIVTLV